MKPIRFSVIPALVLLCLLRAEGQDEQTASGGSCVCITLYDPVCGVDGKTYSNSCVAGCAGVATHCQGECPCKNKCSCDPKPVCGSDGLTYLNECRAKVAGVAVVCDNSCPCKSPSICAVISCAVPCFRQNCPNFPNAQCIASGTCGCSEVYISDCEVVDCDTTPPRPSVVPPLCLKKGQKCKIVANNSQEKCCTGLTCCPTDCVSTKDADSGSGGIELSVSSANGECENSCNCP